MIKNDYKITDIDENVTNKDFIKISPKKQIFSDENKLVKVQEKILVTQNDESFDEDLESSSFSNTYRSSTIPGEMYVSVSTFSQNESS